jgi:hypothetical protein
MWPNLTNFNPIGGGKRGTKQEQDEREEHNAHQPDTIEFHSLGSMNHANSINRKRPRGRIPVERSVMEMNTCEREIVEHTRISNTKYPNLQQEVALRT